MPIRIERQPRLVDPAKALGDAAAVHLGREAAAILAASQAVVPVGSGRLKASGRVEVERRPAGVVAMVGYGGHEAPYAMAVHEDLTATHATGGPKYLEAPARVRFAGLARRLAQTLNGVLRRGGR